MFRDYLLQRLPIVELGDRYVRVDPPEFVDRGFRSQQFVEELLLGLTVTEVRANQLAVVKDIARVLVRQHLHAGEYAVYKPQLVLVV